MDIKELITQIKKELNIERFDILISESHESKMTGNEDGTFKIYYCKKDGDIRAILAHELYHVYQYTLRTLFTCWTMREIFWKGKPVNRNNIYLIEQGAILYENYWRERLGLPLRELTHGNSNLIKQANAS